MELRGEGVQLVVEHADDEEARPGLLVQVSNEDEGQAALVLEREDVEQLLAFLGQWLTETEQARDRCTADQHVLPHTGCVLR